jgi:hypothetical protein
MFFLIHKLCAQLVEISYAHNSTFKKNYAHNLSLERKIYAQVILQLVVHTSCTHKFCANQTYA